MSVNMVKLTFMLLLFCIVNSSTFEYYEPHITAVLNFLNSNPNKIYEYKKGTLVNALRNKADIVELTVDVDVICILNTQFEGVPCTEQQQICNGFVQENQNEKDYKVLSDVKCKPKGDISNENVDDLTTVLPFTEPFAEQKENIELSHEAVSLEQNADFVAVKANTVPCLGCPTDLDPNVEGVSTLVDTALRHVETERTQKQAAIKVIRLQQQVVAGIKYILILEIAPTICQKDVDLSSNNCPIDQNSSTSVCEVIFLQQPWINKLKHIIKNNCTISQEYNVDQKSEINREIENKVNLFDRNNPNSGSVNGKIDDISDDALIELESQIVPVDHEKNEPITENSPNFGVKGVTENVNYADYNSNRGNLNNSSEEDIEHNELKRSIDQMKEIQQGKTLPLKDSGALQDIEPNKYRENLIGGPIRIDVNDSKVIQFTNDALARLDSMSEHPNRYKVIDIISATSQLVAGIKYTIKVKMSLSDCLKNESKSLSDCGFFQNTEIKQCDVIVWDRPWLNLTLTALECDDNKTYPYEYSPPRNKRSAGTEHSEVDIKEHKEYRRDVVVGAPSEIDVNDSQIIQFTNDALTRLDSMSDRPNRYKVIDISATSQVVAGIKYTIKAKISLSDCLKNDSTLLKDCGLLQDAEIKQCDIIVWDRPWLNKRKTTIKCDGNTEYTFETSPKKSKRSADGSYSEVIQNIETETNPNILKQVKTGDDILINMFQDFMMKYNKSYLTATDLNYRLKIFKDNLKTIKLLNKYEQGTATYGITQFSDLTRTEFSKSHGLRVDLHHENYIPFATAVTPNIKLPTEFDWRTKGAVTKVKNQGSCGSCWAFSTTGNIEGQYAIKYGKLVELSEQELVDCDKLDEGCNGGLMDNAYRSIEEIGGLESESDYPYDAVDETCHFSKAQVKVQITGALNISHNETDMAKWLVKNGPIAIAINANAMQFYVGGVSHPWKMLCNPTNLDHGVLIVGYGVHYYPLFKKTLPYWIVKNSWGSSWGEQGYYRVYRGDGTCGVNQTPSSSIVT